MGSTVTSKKSARVVFLADPNYTGEDTFTDQYFYIPNSENYKSFGIEISGGNVGEEGAVTIAGIYGAMFGPQFVNGIPDGAANDGLALPGNYREILMADAGDDIVIAGDAAKVTMFSLYVPLRCGIVVGLSNIAADGAISVYMTDTQFDDE